MSADQKWNPEQSLLQRLVAFEEGEPSNVSEADLRARLEWIIREVVATKSWDQHRRVEAGKITDTLGRWPAAIMERR